MVSSIVEVDLTSSQDSPSGKSKMKQARLPFAPVNQTEKKQDEGLSDKKRKLEVAGSPEVTKKVAKLDLGKHSPGVKNTSVKAKLAAFRNDQENSEKVEAEVAKENESPAPQEADDQAEVGKSQNKQLKSKEPVGKFSGLLKLPFKKKDKKNSEKVLEKKDSDDDILLEDECAVLEVSDVGTPGKQVEKEDTEEEDVSMTEKWASFHEENPEAIEPKVAKVKTKLKAAVKKKGSTEKKTKAIDNGKGVAEIVSTKDGKGESQESSNREEKKVDGKPIKSQDEESSSGKDDKKDSVKNPKEEEKKPKEGPLTKFFSKISSSKLTSSEIPKADEDIEIVSMKRVGTPLRSSPRKSSSGSASPFDPAMVKAVAKSKLKVKITELKIEMEKAVADQDFMKAHEVKQKIVKLEEEMKNEEEVDDIDISNGSIASTPIRASPRKRPPTTPSSSRTISKVATPGSATSTLSTGSPASTNPLKKLTPAQQKKKEEAAKKKEALEAEKKAKKEESAKKKEEERLEKERKKEVERRAKEVEKKAKELEKEKEKKLKEEERDKKKAEKELELKAKEEEKAKKEEEKAKKEEEKKAQEAAEKEKLLKKAQAFKSFFKKEEVKEKEVKAEVEKNTGFFGILHKGKNMRLAPLVRGDPEKAKSNIDSLEMPSGPEGLYLHLLQTKRHKPLSQGRTWPYAKKGEHLDDEDVTVVEDEDEEDDEDGGDDGGVAIDIKMSHLLANMPRAKLLKFHENQRPAYWGTWASKTSKVIGPRRPFAKDEDHFEYDYDSDDDWEEEEEGEDLDEMDKEDQEEKDKDDYEVDNDFFVPHGYLSDGEEEKDEDEVFDPEAAKHKLKLREQEFEAEQKKKTKELKPRLWGCFWEEADLDTAASQLVRVLTGFSGIIDGNNNGPIETGFSKVDCDDDANEINEKLGEDMDSPDASAKKKGKKPRPFLEEALPDLVRLVHRNPNSKNFLVKEFQKFWQSKNTGDEEEEVGTNLVSSISNRALVNKILEVAVWTRAGMLWIVKDEVLERLGVKADAPNEWKYLLEPSNVRNTEKQDKEVNNSSIVSSPAPSPAASSLITKFAKVMTAEEREERRVKMEKEALLAKEKREALKAEQLAKADHAKRMELKKQMEAKSKLAKENKAKKKEKDQSKNTLNGTTESPCLTGSPSLALPPSTTITQIKGEGSPANTKTVGQVKSNSKKCLKSQSPAPQISIRKDLTKASPNPSASKRSGGPVASPIPTKTTFLTQFNIPTPQSSPAAVENQNARRSSPRKLPSIQKPSIDCITIDDSN